MAIAWQCFIADQLMRGRIDGYYVFVTSRLLMYSYLFQGVYRSWKVIEFEIQILHVWKVAENCQIVAAFLTHVLVSGLYIHIIVYCHSFRHG